MSPHLSWSKLVPGLIAIAIVVAFATAVIAFGGFGHVRGDTIRLHVVTNEARGLMKGGDVWLNGQRIGTVEDIAFLAPHSDTSARVIVRIEVEADDAIQIRRNSEVQIRAGGNVMGPIVVYVTAGSTASPRVNDGDTLRAAAQSDFENASATLAAATEELGPIVSNTKAIIARARDTSWSLVAALSGGEVAQFRRNFSRLTSRFGGTPPTAPTASLVARSRGALARVDSVRALLASPNTSYGRFKRDSTLADVIGGVRDELAALQERMASDDGTLGRLRADSAIVRQLTQARSEMAALFADVRRRPSRYIAF